MTYPRAMAHRPASPVADQRERTPPRVRPDLDAQADRSRGGLLFLAVVYCWATADRLIRKAHRHG